VLVALRCPLKLAASACRLAKPRALAAMRLCLLAQLLLLVLAVTCYWLVGAPFLARVPQFLWFRPKALVQVV
jgi:hypothetical protein